MRRILCGIAYQAGPRGDYLWGYLKIMAWAMLFFFAAYEYENVFTSSAFLHINFLFPIQFISLGLASNTDCLKLAHCLVLLVMGTGVKFRHLL